MKSYKKILFETKDQVAYIGFGLETTKSMTVIDSDTYLELEQIIEEVHNNQKKLKGVVFHSLNEKSFLAGVDINIIKSFKVEGDAASEAERGQLVYNKIEDLKIPTVCCIHGICLGGGTELALSTNHIIMSDDPSSIIGLPEVKLGIIPGLGGTYRMPKRVGLAFGLELILTGKSIRAKKAKKKGLVDEIYPKENLLKMSLKHLEKRKTTSIKTFFKDLIFDNSITKKVIFQKARENVLKKTRGHYQAPLKILDVMESAITKSRESYLQKEAQAFGELSLGGQSKNLCNLFFLTEEVKKYQGPKADDFLVLKRGACLGAGVMGGGISWLMAENNMAPCMKDLSWKSCEIGLNQASKNFAEKVKRRQMSSDESERKLRTIRPQLDYKGFKKVDLVVEAVVEDINVKERVLKEVEESVREETVITSNTSSLSIEKMAEFLQYPERFAGLHFFNPVHRMPLVEIGTHSKVAPQTLKSLHDWILKTKKTPIIVKDGPGLLVNRILMPYLNESTFLLESGIKPWDLDTACVHFGMPMGPCRLMDEIGLDVIMKVSHILHQGLGDRATPAQLPEKMLEKGWQGKKALKGFYNYDEKGKETGPNKDVSILLSDKIQMNEIEIQMRVIIPMINEASYVLDENIVKDAATVDLGLIFGTGFPPFRGGLLRYADSEGNDKIYDSLVRFAETVSKERYAPSARLKDLAASKSKFYH